MATTALRWCAATVCAVLGPPGQRPLLLAVALLPIALPALVLLPWPSGDAHAAPPVDTSAAAPARHQGATQDSVRPRRIVSTNVCTDQLLMSLVPAQRIASVSFLAADPQVSLYAEQAQQLPLNHGGVEEVIALSPDLVLAGRYTATTTSAMLGDLGYRVIVLEPAASVADIQRNLRLVAAAVGEPAAAVKMLRQMNARLRRARYQGSDRPLFVNYMVNGWVSGKGTLVHDLVAAAGFETLGSVLDFSGTRQVSLEQLLHLRPALIDLGRRWADPPALATQTLTHPALAHLLAQAGSIQIEDPWWACGLAESVQVIERLSEVHRQLRAQTPSAAGLRERSARASR